MRLMVIGEGITKQRAGEIVNETTGGDLRPLQAEDLGLQLPSREFSFDSIAAPAGLATFPGKPQCRFHNAKFIGLSRSIRVSNSAIGNRHRQFETIRSSRT